MIEATTDRYSTAAGTITNTFAWDDVGRMDSEDMAVSFGTARTYTHEYAYDAANRLTQQTYPDLSVVDRDYTDRNQLDDVNYTPSGGSAAAVIDLVFDDGMRETQRTHGNGLITTKTYDRDDNYVTDIRVETALTLNDRQGLSFNYGTAGYDANKNPLLETTGGVMAAYSWTTAGGSTGAYDDEDRLTFWKRTTGSVAREWPIGATTGLTDVGDWNSVIIDGTTQTRTHGAAHMLTEINMTSTHSYDVKGNITEDKSKSPDYHYQWDFDNRMSAASVDGSSTVYEIEYTYDALGRRVSKTVPRGMGSVTTVYACMGGQVSSEYAASVRTTLPLCKFVYGAYIDEPLILIKVDEREIGGGGGNDPQELGTAPATTIVETRYYYHTNRLFCVTGLTNSSKVVVERYAYTAYGGTTILAPNGTTVRTVSTYNNPYMYTGRRWDPETGLYYYRARYYDVDLGRFVGRDIILYGGGPNLYAYTGNHPLAMVDPLGLVGSINAPHSMTGNMNVWTGEPVPPMGPLPEYDPYKANWTNTGDTASGPLLHTHFSIVIFFPCECGLDRQTIEDDVYSHLQEFDLFSRGHNTVATADVEPADVTGGNGRVARFNMLGGWFAGGNTSSVSPWISISPGVTFGSIPYCTIDSVNCIEV